MCRRDSHDRRERFGLLRDSGACAACEGLGERAGRGDERLAARRAGELEPAREIYARLLPVARFDMDPKLVQYFKAAQDEVGFVGGPTRAPRLPLNADERAALDAALAVLKAGVAA